MKLHKSYLMLVLAIALFSTGCQTPEKAPVGTRELITVRNFNRIVGMQWMLQSMTIEGRQYPLAGEMPYIQFSADNKINGFGSVNRFFGGVQIGDRGELLWPGPFGMTRMAGPEELMKQEDAFVKALPKTEQLSVAGIYLYAYSKDRRIELVFYVPVE